VLEYFSAYNFHRHFPVSTVLTWNGRRYVDRTRRYNWWALQEARLRRADITQFSDEREWERQDVISAYYANMMAAGRQRQARRWLAEHLPASEWRWVRRHEQELHAIVVTAAWRSGRPVQAPLVDLTQSPLI
ncbi:MAG: hypothetical protein LC772_10750, partial [Chloroflexi bacterium]|nr:hypothetical protein [Chloroflexota bacterium]